MMTTRAAAPMWSSSATARLALPASIFFTLATSDVSARAALVRISTRAPAGAPVIATLQRSEEHTSELQSLMRISYAVFCLKKKLQKDQSYKKQVTNM